MRGSGGRPPEVKVMRLASCAAKDANHGCTVHRHPDAAQPGRSCRQDGMRGSGDRPPENAVTGHQSPAPANHSFTMHRHLTPPGTNPPAVRTARGGLGVAPQISQHANHGCTVHRHPDAAQPDDRCRQDGMRGSGGRPPEVRVMRHASCVLRGQGREPQLHRASSPDAAQPGRSCRQDGMRGSGGRPPEVRVRVMRHASCVLRGQGREPQLHRASSP